MWLPLLRVRLGRGHTLARAPILAVVDSGSPFCLFRADNAAAIGIKDIITGKLAKMGGAKKGSEDTYWFHKIKLYIESDWTIEVWAGFSPNLSVGGLLGRNGFFDHFFVLFDHSANPPQLDVTKIDRVQ